MTVLGAEGEPIGLGPSTFGAATWKQVQVTCWDLRN